MNSSPRSDFVSHFLGLGLLLGFLIRKSFWQFLKRSTRQKIRYTFYQKFLADWRFSLLLHRSATGVEDIPLRFELCRSADPGVLVSKAIKSHVPHRPKAFNEHVFAKGYPYIVDH
jgi:hypothetical protein